MLALLLLGMSGWAAAQGLDEELQQSFIEANVPAEGDFHAYLQRDVLAYLQAEYSPRMDHVTTTLLRQAPTQSGLAYPKFYLWVVARTSDGKVVEGAARTAAVDRLYFEVTHFLPREVILADHQAVYSAFPAALFADIQARAAAD